eukprot:3914309-Rhodomonas_salina.2
MCEVVSEKGISFSKAVAEKGLFYYAEVVEKVGVHYRGEAEKGTCYDAYLEGFAALVSLQPDPYQPGAGIHPISAPCISKQDPSISVPGIA